MTNTIRRHAKAFFLICVAGQAGAADLALPQGARLTLQETDAFSSYDVPLASWVEEIGISHLRVEGPVTREAWRLDGSSATTLQILAPLREQLRDQGFEDLFECASAGCGGFDFRFGTFVMPGPDMYVNLTDFRFLSARRATGEHITLLVSRDSASGYVQIIRVGVGAPTATTIADRTPARAIAPAGSLIEALETQGHAVLSDLVFESGVATLGDALVASLDEIAGYLRANPDREILFVGHTDATGALDANVALSRRRASAAVDYLRTRHDIPARQIGSDGVGFLSPITSNLTAAGRDANRRVEAVLISTE